jgi:integrase/recombinase XerD
LIIFVSRLYPGYKTFVSLENKGIQKNTMNKKSTSKKQINNYSPGTGINVRLRGKRLTDNKISLYLDYYQGYTKTSTGEIKVNRKIEYLKIYLSGNPKDSLERDRNNEYLELAQNIRSKRESDLLHNPEGLISPQKKKVNFFDYCQAFIDHYQKKDIRMVKNAVAQFKEYTGETYVKPFQIDKKMIMGFRDYLLNKFSGEGPNSYFARFKKILNRATDEGLFLKNPAEKITCPVPDGISKEILMPDEIIKLAETDCGNSEIKRAFLFSLNTGLRFVDIIDLQNKHLQNDRLVKRQQKTGKQVSIDLNKTAIKLIGKQGKPDELVFNLPSFTGCLKTLKNWATRAGINKNITWHSARHSFGTILLMNKTDIKTVSSLLGHSKLEHTQKYTHLIDELKKVAVDTMPELDI